MSPRPARTAHDVHRVRILAGLDRRLLCAEYLERAFMERVRDLRKAPDTSKGKPLDNPVPEPARTHVFQNRHHLPEHHHLRRGRYRSA